MCSITSCCLSSQNFGLTSSWNHQEPTEIEKLTTVSGEKGASGKKVQCGNSQLVQHCFPMFMDHGKKHMGVFSEDSSHIQRYKHQITHSPFLKITLLWKSKVSGRKWVHGFTNRRELVKMVIAPFSCTWTINWSSKTCTSSSSRLHHIMMYMEIEYD